MNKLLTLLSALLLSSGLHAAGLDGISNTDAASGVREALAKGADYAVNSLGVSNGFLNNSKVKIPLPDGLQAAEKAMRTFGMGKQADELVVTMNHAAEQAVAEARPILTDAVKKMTVQDAKAILTGGDDSVTQYFRRTAGEALSKRFLPIVEQSTKKVALADKYNQFAGKAAKTGLLDAKDANLDSYVTQKAMDGLFLIIAEQEKSLRSNPLGASSNLLKKVFGAL